MDIQSKAILITGGGSGIGLALADAFAARKAQVLIAGRSAERLEEACKTRPGLRSLVCDVSDPAQVAALAARVREEYPNLRILVNNAAQLTVYDAATDARAVELAQAEFATNLHGPISLTAALLPLLRTQPQAAIINVSSGVALVPMTSTPAYSASKAALHSWTISLRYALRETPVQVLEVFPPMVDTAMPAALQGRARGMKRMPPEKMAAAVLQAIDDGREELLVGQSRLLAWMLRIAPGFTQRQLHGL